VEGGPFSFLLVLEAGELIKPHFPVTAIPC
jgi:hypothetical protein